MKKFFMLICASLLVFSCKNVASDDDNENGISAPINPADYVEKTVRWPKWISVFKVNTMNVEWRSPDNKGMCKVSEDFISYFEPISSDVISNITHEDDIEKLEGIFYFPRREPSPERAMLMFDFYPNAKPKAVRLFPYFGCVKKSEVEKNPEAQFVDFPQGENPDIFEFDCDLAPFTEEVWTAPLGTTNPVHCKFERKTLDEGGRGFLLTIAAKGKKVFEGIAWIPNVTEDFRIWSNHTKTWNEPVEIMPGGAIGKKPTWFVNNVEQPSHERVFVLPAQGEQECVNVVRAEMTVDGETFRSNEITIFNTQKSDSESLEKLKSLAEIVQNYVAQNGIQTAFSVAVNTPNVEFAFNAGKTSLVSSEICDVDTLHYFYSITKTFTAALTLKLAEEGVLDLNKIDGDYFYEHFDELQRKPRRQSQLGRAFEPSFSRPAVKMSCDLLIFVRKWANHAYENAVSA